MDGENISLSRLAPAECQIRRGCHRRRYGQVERVTERSALRTQSFHGRADVGDRRYLAIYGGRETMAQNTAGMVTCHEMRKKKKSLVDSDSAINRRAVIAHQLSSGRGHWVTCYWHVLYPGCSSNDRHVFRALMMEHEGRARPCAPWGFVNPKWNRPADRGCLWWRGGSRGRSTSLRGAYTPPMGMSAIIVDENRL